MAPPWLPQPLESEVANLYLSELPSASLGSDCFGEGFLREMFLLQRPRLLLPPSPGPWGRPFVSISHEAGEPGCGRRRAAWGLH